MSAFQSTLNAVVIGGLLVLAIHYFIKGDRDDAGTALIAAAGWATGFVVYLLGTGL